MGAFLKKNGFSIVEDFKNMKCNYEKFSMEWEYMDGIDDRCMVNTALEWINSTGNNSLTICWTMQTHYPYFSSGVELQYPTSNKDFNRYLNALNNSDKAFGYLMEGLQKENKLDETLVIVTSDHGEAFGRHDQVTHSSKIYEENINIPLMLINPKLFFGETDVRIGGLIDIAPTVLHILGINSPAEWEGRSLVNDQPKTRTFFFCPYADFLFGTRYANWKYIYNASTSSSELYDLNIDPKESKNLASIYKSFVDSQYHYIGAWVQFHTNKLKSTY